ncbi:MAG: hypothetical protein ABFE07_23535 [Armatimonadia bacterium]
MKLVKYGRRDPNHGEIKQALLACGCSVLDLADTGNSIPDLLVGRHGRSFLLEVKSPTGKEKPGQTQAREAWRGGPWHVVRSVQEALKAVGIA